MKQNEIRKLGDCLVMLGHDLQAWEGPDSLAMCVPRIVMNHVERFIGGKWLSADEHRKMIDKLLDYDRVSGSD